jgi:hypothetical protein
MNEQGNKTTDNGTVPVIRNVADNVNLHLVITDWHDQISAVIRGIDEPNCWYTFDAETRSARLRLAAINTYIGNDIKELKRDDGILVEHLHVAWQSYTNDEGELIEGPVMTLITPQGRCYRVAAKYFILQVLLFAKNWERCPWIPPVRMSARDVVLDSGNRTYQLEVRE